MGITVLLLLVRTMAEESRAEFEEADKPHHIQISDTFQTYLLIPGLLLLAVLGKLIVKYDFVASTLASPTHPFAVGFPFNTGWTV